MNDLRKLYPIIIAVILPLTSLGKFQSSPTWEFNGIDYPTDMTVADFNNDGKNDIMIAAIKGSGKNISGNILIFLQRNSGFSQTPDRKIKLKFPRGITAGDFDNDGKTDFAVSENAVKMHIFLGKDKFSKPYTDHSVNQYQVKIQATKLSADARMDFLCGPVWRKWFGGNKFASGYVYQPKGERYNTNVIIDDIDGDAQADMIFASQKHIRVYIGPFNVLKVKPANMSQFYNFLVYVSPATVQIADINNDCLPDIVFCGDCKEKNYGIKAFIQGRFNTFEEKSTPKTIIPDLSGSFVAEDFNADGLTDIAVADCNWSKAELRIYLADEKGLHPNLFRKISVKAKQVLFVKSFDINKDGKKDLVVSCLDKLLIYMNQDKNR